MSVWQKYIFLIPISLSAALWISGCSETKLSQCQRLITLVDQGNSLIEKDKGYQVTTSLQLAKDLENVTKSLEEKKFKDPQLVDFQTKFTKVFGTLHQEIAKAGKALGATKAAKSSLDGRIRIEKAREQIDTHLTAAKSAGKSFDDLFAQLNTYCNVPENTTQQ